MTIKIAIIIAVLLGFTSTVSASVSAETPSDETTHTFYYNAIATKVEVAPAEEANQNESETVAVTVRLTNGPQKGKTALAFWDNNPETSRIFVVNEGDKLIMSCSSTVNDAQECAIVDQQRLGGLMLLLGLFFLSIWFVARKHGVMAFISLLFGLFIVVTAVIPLILTGISPLLVTIIAGLVIIFPSIYLSHGFNTKAHIALVSIIGATGLIALLAAIFSHVLDLNGLISEETFYLHNNINLKSLLLGAIVLGAFGVIDDIAMTQVSIVNELHHSNKNLSAYALFKRAMHVGRDHIASVINTLFLAYIGVGLPLLVLVRQHDVPLLIALQQEPLATEIMRTLVGTIGLVLVVPLATLVAAEIITRRPELFPEHEHHHIH